MALHTLIVLGTDIYKTLFTIINIKRDQIKYTVPLQCLLVYKCMLIFSSTNSLLPLSSASVLAGTPVEMRPEQPPGHDHLPTHSDLHCKYQYSEEK